MIESCLEYMRTRTDLWEILLLIMPLTPAVQTSVIIDHLEINDSPMKRADDGSEPQLSSTSKRAV